MSEKEAEKIPALTIINGAEPVQVSFIDGRAPEIVNVRLLPIKMLGDYLSNVGDINALVDMFCDKPAGWSTTITDDSIYAIDELGRKYNDPRVGRMLKRQQAAVGNLAPMLKQATALTSSLQT